ncbi:MAG: DNA mismatch repair endonuclease MutL [Syntrophomonadaceae bacterium]|nr:DNA mismatch repair endonuclease MutL [Syntrophomonadaceae bacterium]
MNRIKLLDKTLIDKIAAGEVVERPASVVKELVENSLDAGSRRIEAEIAGGGLELIRVADDGSGIAEADLLLAFARHATSKISEESHLWALTSMGFRGEALSSIGAVSKAEMCSNPDQEGHCIQVEGGEVLSLKPASSPPGTIITVRDLFYNTPARKKFVKSAITEGNQVYDIMLRLAFSHPEVSFSFSNERRRVFLTSGNGRIDQVALAVFGQDYARRLIQFEHQYGTIRVHGLTSNLELTRKNRKGQIFLVNGRVVKNPILSVAMEEAYRGLLLNRERPVGIIYLTIPPGQIDVNVHPQKTEIRFDDERAVFQAVKSSVRTALFQQNNPNITGEEFLARLESEQANQSSQKVPSYTKYQSTLPLRYNSPGGGEFNESADKWSDAKNAEILPEPTRWDETWQQLVPENYGSGSRITIFGQWQDSYLLCELDERLVIVDQHAAHERLLFNQLKKSESPVIQQELAVPVAIELPDDLLMIAEEKNELLQGLGYCLDRFGEKSMVIRMIPAMATDQEVETLMEILEQLQNSFLDDELYLDAGLKILACKGSVKAGQRLGQMEITRLLEEWSRTDTRDFCPHGRPVCMVLEKSDLDKLLKR